MVSNYGRRTVSKPRGSALKQLSWAITFFLCGYIAATLFDFGHLCNWVKAHLLTSQTGQHESVNLPAKQADLPKPKFEFYTLLAKDNSTSPSPAPVAVVETKRMVQPTVQSATDLAAESPAEIASTQKPVMQSVPVAEDIAPSPIMNTNGSYLVQLASFKNKLDAEHMRAQLTLKGFNVNVVMVSQQHMSWFRVVVGPFNLRADAEKAQSSIAESERIKGIIRKSDA